MPPSRCRPPPSPPCCLPGERLRVDAAGNGCFAVVHRDSVPDAVRVVRERAVDAVLVSVHRCAPEQVEAVRHLVQRVPRHPHRRAGLPARSRLHRDAAPARAPPGVRQVVDVTSPAGWSRLRQVVGQPATRAAARIQGPILTALAEAPPDARLFVEAMIRLAPDTPTVTALAERLYVRPSTLMSRFARAGLPSPKNYLSAIRLLHAAYLFEAARAVGGGRGLPAGVLLAPELRPASPRHAGRDGAGVPPPVPLSGGAGAVRGADGRAVSCRCGGTFIRWRACSIVSRG